MRLLPSVLVGVTVVLLVTPPDVPASRGVALDLGRIDVTQKLTPGGNYKLPTFHVRNPGTETTSYTIGISSVIGQKAKQPPSSWFRFKPSSLTLAPGASGAVVARIALPTGADPGAYETLIAAQVASEGSGAQVGAAASFPDQLHRRAGDPARCDLGESEDRHVRRCSLVVALPGADRDRGRCLAAGTPLLAPDRAQEVKRILLIAALVALSTAGQPALSASPRGPIGASVRPQELTLALAAPSETKTGTTFSAQTTARNIGKRILRSVKISLDTPTGLKGGGTKTVGSITPGSSARQTWSLCTSLPGNYILVARATYADAAGRTINVTSQARVVTVTRARNAHC